MFLAVGASVFVEVMFEGDTDVADASVWGAEEFVWQAVKNNANSKKRAIVLLVALTLVRNGMAFLMAIADITERTVDPGRSTCDFISIVCVPECKWPHFFDNVR